MKRETLMIQPEKHKRRIGILPTYVQRDLTKYSRKQKHAGKVEGREQHGKREVFPVVFSYAGLAQLEEQSLRKR